MALPSLSFIAGVAVLLYLASFVLFALIRVVTGISIQRLGYTGLRRIAYTPREGIKIELRGLGLNLHRPTFAQPTWLSVVLTELKVTVDLKLLSGKPRKRAPWARWPNGSSKNQEKTSPITPASPLSPGTPGEEDDMLSDEENQRSRTWERLTEMKERIKRLHSKIHWIRLVDLVADTSSLVIVDVGSIQVSNFTMAVDTRRKTVDRRRLFQHRRVKSDTQRPAEWIFTVRSVLFSPEGSDSTEVLDHCTLNVHGLLYKELEGLRDASISLKLGRLNIPYDDISTCRERARRCRRLHHRNMTVGSDTEISFSDLIEELDNPGSREENIVRTVSDSKDFVASILRGIQEVQFNVSFFGLTKRIRSANPTGTPVYLNMSMKEVGLDLLRLDPRSPAHLMYFSPNDVAHQALLAAISISVGIDDGHEHPERLLYIPMATNTAKTTLPSKTIQYQGDKNVAERNTNILFANLVVTSPSIDVDPRHLPLVLALLQSSETRPMSRPNALHSKRHIISRLLPKANIKISIHEPVARVTLPPMEEEKKGTDEFDLLISAMSNISLDVESSHSAGGELHYSLSANFRTTSHQLYYQTASGMKHNLLLTDHFELRTQVSASPEVAVVASGNIQTFVVYMVRPEITEGIRQIVAQLRSEDSPVRRYTSKGSQGSFLRKIPPWLLHVYMQGSDFSIEIAGVDPEVSQHARGLAVHLDSWTAEYKANRGEETDTRPARRRASSRTIQRDEYLLRPATSNSPRKKQGYATDGRRLAIHTQGLEGFVVESADTWEPEPFASLRRFEVAFSTSTDNQGPIFHVNSFAKSLYVHYSLYRHFAIGVATMVLRKTFGRKVNLTMPARPQTAQQLSVPDIEVDGMGQLGKPEITTLDFKAGFVQVKATMAEDPPLMIQMQGLESGRHRWASPFARARLVRLYTDTPHVPGVWSRIISLKSLRADYRHSRKKYKDSVVEDKSIDIASDAIRLAVPHQVVIHKIIDNFTNVFKTVKQLHHRFKTNTNENVLDKGPEGPKHVPKISLRSQALLFEIEDGSFEWKLGVIYRLGLVEQKQRLAREEAFRLKVKKLEQLEGRRGSTRYRAKSAQGRGRSKKAKFSGANERSKSESPTRRSPPSGHGRHIRYDSECKPDISEQSRVDKDKAWEKLQRLNAQSWKKRIDHGMTCQTRTMRDIRSVFWGLDEMQDDAEQKEPILAIPQRPALMGILVSDFHLLVDKPSFPLSDYPHFLNRIGKGMPQDMKYALLIPMNVQINMGEARLTLRDYPLPLIHVPAIRQGQSPRLPSLSLKTDFVIAEEFRNQESIRRVDIVVVPPETSESGKNSGGFVVDVPRTVSPVKTYSDITVDINTAYPTRITWGTSYQPAIQDMMQIIESFTKPAVDPSERVGFWDKIRLTFHSRINVAWKGDGDVHLILKASRDPYMVTGTGAGFVMCWQNDVRWSICQHEDPRKFMTVTSGSYILAIPDLSHYARQSHDSTTSDSDTLSSVSSYKQTPKFRKTIMKLSGKVQWLAGLVFERALEGDGRSFDFIPHYNVVLKHPKYVRDVGGKRYDAFRGFRSHHIHLSVAVSAPHDRDWTAVNNETSKNYNSVHLTPRFFSHFFSWWSMFSGVMSLPIRQGKLWPGVEKSSKKFGRHLATIKYQILLSPLYMSHIYKHKDVEDHGQGASYATGLKARLDSFMLDLHQRREEFRTLVQMPQNEENKSQNETSGMKIHEAQLDFISADIRGVSSVVPGKAMEDDEAANEEMSSSFEAGSVTVDVNRFTIPDNDLSWIDMDDFVELDWILPNELDPVTKILPLAYAPRFTYFRQTDHQDNISGDPHRHSPFGKEPTHYCAMTETNDPRRVQSQLVQIRLDKVNEQLSQNLRDIGEKQLEMIRSSESKDKLQGELRILHLHHENLQRKRAFLQASFDSLSRRFRVTDKRVPVVDGADDENDVFFEAREDYDPADAEATEPDQGPLADYVTDFNNRFIVHNVHLKWNNSLRNIIIRYVHEVSQRRGFVYYMSRRAVKFILDIVDEQKRIKQRVHEKEASSSASSVKLPYTPDDDQVNIEDRIQQLVEDAKKFVNANDPKNATAETQRADDKEQEISVEYTAQNSYHVRLIAPQIQLQSEKNPKSAVLVTAKGMQLKVIQIMDRDRVSDDVSGLVQRRFNANMDSMQIFVTHSKTFSTEYLHMYSGNRYGTSSGSSWPPWVPFEVMFDFEVNPYGFQRVVQKTSASLRLDKYNTLRLKYNDDVSNPRPGRSKAADNLENRIDHLWIDFPQLRAICDSAQYYALYIMVLDLLLYNEPLEKTRSERLERIMLASDFSDLTGAPEMVMMLQERIRQLEEIRMHFMINEKYLDRQGWKDRVSVESDLAMCEDELFFMMKAITTSQRRIDERTQTDQSTGILRWYISASEIVWHLVKEGNESLAEFQLKDAHYDRTDHNDGSNYNIMQIKRIHGLNLLPNALYPDMISPYIEKDKPNRSHEEDMLRVQWHMLEAIAGIPVMDHFEVNLFPLRVQLEREIGKKLFEYVFPGVDNSSSENGGFSPFMVKHILPSQLEEDEDMENRPIPHSNSDVITTDADRESESTSGAGSLEMRLQPTLSVPDRPKTPHEKKKERTPSTWHNQLHGLGIFREGNKSQTSYRKLLHEKGRIDSSDTLTTASRPASYRTNSNLSSAQTSVEGERSKRFALTRVGSGIKSVTSKDGPTDDLTQMMSRASNYMTLSYVKIPSMVLCLSYKGKSQRNLEDVHNLVFRMPTLEYRNKTWSNLDLALQLKKDVIKALISHAGAIVGNKFSHHRPTKQQQSRLRQIANSSTLLSSGSINDHSGHNSESNSTPGNSSDLSLNEPRQSFTSGKGSELSRSGSFVSSLNSGSGRMSERPSTAGAVLGGQPEAEAIAFADELSRIDQTEPETIKHSLTRHLTNLSHMTGISHRTTGSQEDNDDSTSTKRKSKLLLGKKFLHALPH